MTGIHRERPGADDLTSATAAPAVTLGNDVWMSPGVSNAYALATDAGRVIVNTGLAFEGPLQLSPDVGVRMQTWLDAHPQNLFAPNKYALDEYGLSVEQLEPIFAEYLATFDVEPEGAR